MRLIDSNHGLPWHRRYFQFISPIRCGVIVSYAVPGGVIMLWIFFNYYYFALEAATERLRRLSIYIEINQLCSTYAIHK